MSIEIEKKRQSREIYNGKIIHVQVDEVIIAGKKAEREIVNHPGAAAIIAVTDKKEILLVKQYRYAIGQVLLEIPAGKRDAGEKPETCALRELEEETGYIGTLKKIGVIYTTPGFCDETIYLYMAEQLIKTKQHLDENEYLDVISIPIKKVFQMISEGNIQDAKTLSAFSIARDYLYEK